jgi:phosphoribosyl-AMP cyclohydrolase / phosphoribosyl-ATP pyrophosphohydrolase
MPFNIEEIKFDEKGLVPAVVQDVYSGKVLMLAYMNKESLRKTIETKTTWFFSRSRNSLWNKGETSGNRQFVKRISYDCDGDSLLVEVEQVGNACHTGEESCFFQEISIDNEKLLFNRDIIQYVYHFIVNRRNNPKEGSYTNYLFREGLDKILKKIGEESSEVIIGAKNRNKEELVNELADLVYHSLVLMVEQGVTIEDVKKVMMERHQMKEE